MKTLVLSCDTGQGHNMAANAVCEALERIGAEHEMLDPLAAFCSDKTAHGVTSIYNTMLRKMPGAFGVIYKAGDIYSSTGITSPVYTANAKYAEPLREYILSGDFGSVVATHLFPMLALTALKKQGFSAECFGVLTDYTCVPFFSETALDGYFIPHESLAGELAAHCYGTILRSKKSGGPNRRNRPIASLGTRLVEPLCFSWRGLLPCAFWPAWPPSVPF